MNENLKPKQIPTDEFAKKYDKPENKFYLLDAKKPVYDEKSKRTYFVPVQVQLVVTADGALVGREV